MPEEYCFAVIIAGGRDFTDYGLLKSKCDYFFRDKKPTAILCGEARGADSLGKQYAQKHGIPVQSYPAEWNRYGKKAGYIRNKEMAENADALVAFWDGASKGTKNMIDLAKAKGLPVRIVHYNAEEILEKKKTVMKKALTFFAAIALLVTAYSWYIKEPISEVRPDITGLQGIDEPIISVAESGSKTDSEKNFEEPARELFGPHDVIRVVDGDTAMIRIDGEEKRVRFIGIDTPESVNPDASKNTDEGKRASQYTRDLLTGQKVYLEYDITTEDDYGRTLAYVYLDDGVTMVEDILLREGLATVLTIQPNSKYANHFYEIQRTARESKAGFWSTDFFV